LKKIVLRVPFFHFSAFFSKFLQKSQKKAIFLVFLSFKAFRISPLLKTQNIYGLMKKSLQKKAPLERFFSQKFFEIGQMDIFEMSKIENRKKVCTKNRSKGAFFWRLFLETFFGDFFWRLFLETFFRQKIPQKYP